MKYIVKTAGEYVSPESCVIRLMSESAILSGSAQLSGTTQSFVDEANESNSRFGDSWM